MRMDTHVNLIVVVFFLITIGSANGLFGAYFYTVPPEGQILVMDSIQNVTPVVTIIDQPSVVEFQDEIPPEIHGYVILANPVNACKRVKPPPKIIEAGNSKLNGQGSPEDDDRDGPPSVNKMEWILLASKSNCSYNTKIDHADAAGFGGILIFNVGSNGTEVIGLDDEKNHVPFDIRIPSFFIGAHDGAILNSIFTNDSILRYSIVIETSPPYFKDVINYMLWASLALFLLVILLCLVKPFYDFLLQPWLRVRSRHRRKTLLAQAVTSLSIVEWKEEMLDKHERCVICMEYYGDEEHLRILPCRHGFHSNCIDSWLIKVRRVCPICKAKISYSSCWEDFSDSDISEGNYFTDFAYEPLTPGRNMDEIFEPLEARGFVNIGLGGRSECCSPLDEDDSIGSSSLRFDMDDDGTTGQLTTSTSFVSATVSVHQAMMAAGSRDLSSAESESRYSTPPLEEGD